MKLKNLNTSTYILFTFLFSLQLNASYYTKIGEIVNANLTEVALMPPPNFTYSVSVICKNSPVNPLPTDGPVGGIYSAIPSTTPGLSIDPQTGLINSGISQPGTYTITNTAAPGVSAVITIAAIISPFIIPIGVITVCAGASPSLQVTTLPVVPLSSYSWSSTGNSNFSNSNPVFVTPSVTTSYFAVVKDMYGCTYTVSPKLITVVSFPSNLSLNNPIRCAGSPATTLGIVTGTPPQGTTYSWLPGNYNGPVLPVSPTITTTYTLNMNLSNCQRSLTTVVTVSAAATPTVDFGYPFPICTDNTDPLPIKSEGFTSGGAFFSSDLENFPIDSVTGKISLSSLVAGTYVINYSLAAQGCRVSMTGMSSITLGEVTKMGVGQDITITEGTGTVLFSSNAESFLWEPDAGLNCSDCPTPYATPSQTTKYCVSDPTNGCARGGCITVEVVCLNNGDMSVPSAFTPNKDGKNDKFCLKGWSYCVTDFQIRIFNRWGQMVYETTDSGFCWDGVFNGQELPSGVYVYSIDANVNREKYSKKGNITIIR